MGKNCLPEMKIKKRNVIAGLFDVQNQDCVYTIVEMF
jgi:hypothetical protein